jgi:hypothetical protein
MREHGGASALGRFLGDVEESSIRNWIKGTKPSGAARARIAVALGIRAKAWDAPPPGKGEALEPAALPKPKPMPELPALPMNATTRDLARHQVERIRIEIDHRRSEGIGSRELASLESSYVTALRNLAKVSGEDDITEATVLRHPAFQRCMRVIEEWLEANGDGKVAKLAAALERLAEEGEGS